MSPEAFQTIFDVPRGTMEKLQAYEKLLKDWQPRMNLVGSGTLDHIWSRHFADSAQLARLTPANALWLDIGAGAGFPGLVLASMEHGRFILVESTAKKCRFLEAARETLGLEGRVDIRAERVEMLPTLGVEIATARAAAPLATLLDWSIRHLRPGGLCLFPKGRRWAEEVREAKARFSFDVEPIASMTDPDARILAIRNLKRL